MAQVLKMTAGVKCYNNVRYIREALESAFAQRYRPLEIVVSDDGSTDGSWDVVRSVVEAHRGDDVHVVVNRNETNLGNLGNWERMCELASGDFVVKFDGDDISEPDRITRIVSAVNSALDQGLSPTVVGHGGFLIGPNGESMGVMSPATKGYVVGTAMAFSRRCFTVFGKAVCDLHIVDDELYARRGMMIGDFVEMNDRLVRYRMGTGVSNSLWNMRAPLLRCAHYMLVTLDQCDVDLGKITDKSVVDCWSKRLAEERGQAEARRDLVGGDTIGTRISGAKRLMTYGVVWRFLKFAFVMPRCVGDVLLLVYVAVRHIRRISAGVKRG